MHTSCTEEPKQKKKDLDATDMRNIFGSMFACLFVCLFVPVTPVHTVQCRAFKWKIMYQVTF